MSRSDTPIDLDAFSRPERSIPAPTGRRWIWVVPVLLVAAFGAIFWQSARSFFEEPVSVSIVRPKAGALRASAGSSLFQAAGWVEPDPFPISVPALTEGTVEEVLIRESDLVKKGDIVARLIPDHHDLEHEMAKREVELAVAERDRIRVELENAEIARRELIAKRRSFEAAEDSLAELNQTKRKRAAERLALEARVAVAEAEVKTQRLLAKEGVDGPWQLELAEASLKEARGALEVVEATLIEDGLKIRTALRSLEITRRDRELALEETLRVNTARADLARAESAIAVKKADLSLKKLACERLEVRSDSNGVVLSRLVQTGSHVGPEARDADICTLYDPQNLRVRVDVPQSQVALVSTGQKARIVAESRREAYSGEVIRIVQRADIQKVTLEVQVRVTDPDGLLRPEMLAQVAFLAPDDEDASNDGETKQTLLVPSRLVDGSGSVWIVDGLEGVARKRTLEVGAAQGDWRPVLSGLNLSDKLIDRRSSELEEGRAIVIEEDPR